ncbi:MAG: transglycosylase domain-containing protein [Chloroflexi bacterium]|nr:transglycosylase domain-containing protein [Chloroflexota bacterium]
MKRTRFLRLLPLLLLALLGGTWYWLFGDLPAPAELTNRLATPSIHITDRNGRSLYNILDQQGGRHTNLPLEQIPLALQQATIATEDRNFYANPGVDLEGIARALWINLQGGEVLAGGSTITQQLARNLLLAADERTERTVRRKLRKAGWRGASPAPSAKMKSSPSISTRAITADWPMGLKPPLQTYFGHPRQPTHPRRIRPTGRG